MPEKRHDVTSVFLENDRRFGERFEDFEPFFAALGDDSRVGQSVFYASSEHGSTHNSATKTKSSTLPAGIKMDLSSPTPSVQRNQSIHMNESNMSLPYQSLDPIYTSTPSHGDNVDDQMRTVNCRLNKIEDMLEQITSVYKNEVADITRALDEERFKNKKLEDLVNETIELHQAEFLSLKQEQKNMASRLDYQYNDRFRQVEESAENVQNQICRLENSMKQAIDVRLGGGTDWGNAVLLPVVNILVDLLRLSLYLLATVLDVIRPFTGSRYRAGALLFIVISALLVLNYSDPTSLFRRKTQPQSNEL
ncbi:unnamed protein product [Auanema sp. JU1783]|nr:unnamed protein product [Auanema sp. JU1783]